MHQTTVRFGPDLWQAVERECERLGVSAAQYLREAALARLAYTGGRAGFPAYELALSTAGTAAGANALERAHIAAARAIADAAPRAAEVASEALSDSAAVIAQSRQARAQARDVRRHSQSLRKPAAALS